MADGEPVAAATYDRGYTTWRTHRVVVLPAAANPPLCAILPGRRNPGHRSRQHHQSGGLADIRGGGPATARPSPTSSAAASPASTCNRRLRRYFCRRSCRWGPLRAAATLADAVGAFGPLSNPPPQAAGAGASGDTWQNVGIPAYDAEFAAAAAELIKQTRVAGDSLGAAVEVGASTCRRWPAILYQSLKLRLMGLGGLHAVQACEIGDGAAVAGGGAARTTTPSARAAMPPTAMAASSAALPPATRWWLRLLQANQLYRPAAAVSAQESEEIDFELRKGGTTCGRARRGDAGVAHGDRGDERRPDARLAAGRSGRLQPVLADGRRPGYGLPVLKIYLIRDPCGCSLLHLCRPCNLWALPAWKRLALLPN